ncbi:helix-turn-helix domain-containing protein [Paenibacillus sp. sgz302251]|uniref:helix-turn-helix domain-containing protein n=1 Tax=Paenibacillus sp. sgz302251 TaxID=3414493 RepID=UPI003C7ACAC7
MHISQTSYPWFRLKGDAMIETIGRISAINKHPNRVLPYWVIGIVHSGERTVKLGRYSGKAMVGDYFLMPPNQYHSGIEIDEHDVSFIHFAMQGEAIDIPLEIDSSRIALPVFGQIPKDTDLFKTFHYMYDQYRSELVDNHFLNIQLQAALHQISFHMQKRQVLNTRNNRMGDEIFQFILTNLTEELTAEVFEDRFGLSYRQLNINFKKQFKTTIKQKVIELRIDHAYQLLMLGETIADAANKSGFKDYFYFLKCFKKIKHLTPKDVKKSFFH